MILSELQGESARRHVVGALAAVCAHAAVFGAAQVAPAPAPALVIVSEVELAPAEPQAQKPAAQPPSVPEPEAPAPPEKPVARPARPVRAPRLTPSASTAQTTEPGPASAGALHTAREDAKTPGEPVRFAVDPNGQAYGFGVVAQGGSGLGRGGAGPVGNVHGGASGAPSGLKSEYARTFAVPPLLHESDPCRGYFPHDAQLDAGDVEVRLWIDAQGAVTRVKVISENPAGQGFGLSARSCLQAKRFAPARDAEGRDIAAQLPVTIKFSR